MKSSLSHALNRAVRIQGFISRALPTGREKLFLNCIQRIIYQCKKWSTFEDSRYLVCLNDTCRVPIVASVKMFKRENVPRVLVHVLYNFYLLGKNYVSYLLWGVNIIMGRLENWCSVIIQLCREGLNKITNKNLTCVMYCDCWSSRWWWRRRHWQTELLTFWCFLYGLVWGA